ncbi:MAG: TetR/AcrR family transcriptional regulator C-terminal domain-containing protein [Oscillospiraceae bacterium]|nr:TetR/AcrR family transcriptional regulator C-terminal domain-containing protein [Oscillospiraceae bacterium]
MKRKTTKELLAESFLELTESKRIDKIRISDITDNCGMSPPTFYHHFRDKYDLLVWIHTNRVSGIMSKIDRDGYKWRDTLLDGARYYYENRSYIINALKHTSGQGSFVEYVTRSNTELLAKEVRRKLMTEYLPPELYGLIKMYVYGTVYFMLDWLLHDTGQTPEQVAQLWEDGLPEPLRKHLCEA